MAIETELKLRIAPEQLAKLKRHALLKAHQATRPVTRRLYNIYYDTPQLELHNCGMALRLRRAGRQWLQTLKGGGSVKAGLHQRDEWEVPVSGAALDFSLLSKAGVSKTERPQMAAWDKHLPKALRKKLQPVFVSDFSRCSRMLLWQGAQIELCMDRGEVSTKQRAVPICELELELKSGQPQQLFELALAILDIVPFELEVVSKAEQGYRLLSGYAEHPVKAAAASLSRKATLAEVLQSLIWACLLHLQSNLRGAMAGEDAEYLHQMRVALRRLRVVLRMTEKFCADEQLAALKKEVAALDTAWGRIREWDVFISQTMRPMCTYMTGHTGLQALFLASERQRDACKASMRNEAQARGLQHLLLRFAIWMNGPYWHRQQDVLPKLHDFATSYLQKLARRFIRSAEHLDTLDAPHLHALRIVAKKLRYSAEFFSSLYEEKKAGFMAALSDVQKVLGKINDIAVAHRLLEELAANADLSAHQEAVALVKGWIARDLADQLIALHKAMQRFTSQPSFWGE